MSRRPIGSTPSVGSSHPLYRAVLTLSLALVLWHYVTDALIYRFRIPQVREVMLKRLGF